jgi:hypothetical protein
MNDIAIFGWLMYSDGQPNQRGFKGDRSMSDEWVYIIIAALLTPVALFSVTLVIKDERLLKKVDSCADWINRLILTPIHRWLLQPMDRRKPDQFAERAAGERDLVA